jgi:hypothetical protein
MSEELLKQLTERALEDKELLHALLEDTQSALETWGFAPDEIARLKPLIEEGTPLEELDERMSKYLFGGGTSG